MGHVPLRPSSWLTPGPPGLSWGSAVAPPVPPPPAPSGRSKAVLPPAQPSPPVRLLPACASSVTSARGQRAGPGPPRLRHTPVTEPCPPPASQSSWAAVSARGLCPVPVPSDQWNATLMPQPRSRCCLSLPAGTTCCITCSLSTWTPASPTLPLRPPRPCGPSRSPRSLSRAGLPERPGCPSRRTLLQTSRSRKNVSDSELRRQRRGGPPHPRNVTSGVLSELKAKPHHWDFRQGRLVCRPVCVKETLPTTKRTSNGLTTSSPKPRASRRTRPHRPTADARAQTPARQVFILKKLILKMTS